MFLAYYWRWCLHVFIVYVQVYRWRVTTRSCLVHFFVLLCVQIDLLFKSTITYYDTTKRSYRPKRYAEYYRVFINFEFHLSRNGGQVVMGLAGCWEHWIWPTSRLQWSFRHSKTLLFISCLPWQWFTSYQPSLNSWWYGDWIMLLESFFHRHRVAWQT